MSVYTEKRIIYSVGSWQTTFLSWCELIIFKLLNEVGQCDPATHPIKKHFQVEPIPENDDCKKLFHLSIGKMSGRMSKGAVVGL